MTIWIREITSHPRCLGKTHFVTHNIRRGDKESDTVAVSRFQIALQLEQSDRKGKSTGSQSLWITGPWEVSKTKDLLLLRGCSWQGQASGEEGQGPVSS